MTTADPDLFTFTPRYPETPGYTNQTTSKKAAAKVAPKAGTQRGRILDYIKQHGPRTPDELAAALDMLVVSARPRCTELHLMGFLVEVGERMNSNGNDSLLYDLAPPGTLPIESKVSRLAQLEQENEGLRALVAELREQIKGMMQ